MPTRRTTDCVEDEARVTRCGTFTLRAILYRAPSRLIGPRLKVRVYSDRLDCQLSGALGLTLARGTRAPGHRRGRLLDYRHFVDGLKRKPPAFKGLVFRDALFPRDAQRRRWAQLESKLTPRHACQTRVARLEMAARDGVEAVLAARLEALWLAGELPDVKQLREECAPRVLELPHVTVELPAVSRYDARLPRAYAVAA